MTCTTELNKQIQGLQLRLSQAENNISATYIGISQLVTALAATPAAAAAAIMSPIYNLSAVGFNLQQALVNLIPTVDMKKLMMEMASSLESAMLAELEAITSAVMGAIEGAMDAAMAMVDAATGALAAAVDVAADAVSAVNSAAFALESAISFGDVTAIAAAQAELAVANAASSAATSAVSAATNSLVSAQSVLDAFSEESLSAYGFLHGQTDIAKCKSLSAHLS